MPVTCLKSPPLVPQAPGTASPSNANAITFHQNRYLDTHSNDQEGYIPVNNDYLESMELGEGKFHFRTLCCLNFFHLPFPALTLQTGNMVMH